MNARNAERDPVISDYEGPLRKVLESQGPMPFQDLAKPTFSIVTIVLNAEKTIKQTIESVLSQNYPNVEYVIVDGVSRDGSLSVIRSYGNRIHQVISEKDRGIADAFNKGVTLARGQWIGILNADDWYPEGTLARVAQEIQKHPEAEILCGRTQFWIGNDKGYTFDSDPSKLHLDTTVGHQAIFVSKSAHQKYGLYRTDMRYGSDYDFFLRTYHLGAKFQKLDFVVANMRSDGVSDRHWKKVYKEVALVQKDRLGYGWQADRRYIFKILRTTVSRALTASGMDGVVAFYRRHFSLLKKTR